MNRLVLVPLLFLFWVMLTWPGYLSSAYWQDLGIGLVASLAVGWLMGERGAGQLRWLQPHRYGWGLIYLFVLSANIVCANLDVAYRVLHPRMPVRPGIVRIKTRLRSAVARAVLGNSITLTPGTLTVDISDDGEMLVHWIYVHSLDPEEAAERIIGRFEWYIEKIFE